MKKIYLSTSAIALVISTTAFSADLATVKSAPVVSAAPLLWTGFYAGLNSGYAFGTTSGAQNYGWANPASFANSAQGGALSFANSGPGRNVDQGGIFGGGQVGYNYQYGKFLVFGLEADMQGAGVRGTGNAYGFAPVTGNAGYLNNNVIQAGIDWMGTARGRIGFLLSPTTQIYATGGLAYGGVNLSTLPSSNIVQPSVIIRTNLISTQHSAQNLLAGWTGGAGAEWMFAKNWSVKAEALYYDLGSQSVSNMQFYGVPATAGVNPIGGSTTRAYYNGVIARAGINYHFNWNALDEQQLASAADLPSHKSAELAAVTPYWTGVYVGLNSGYAFGASGGAQNYGWANPASFGDQTLTQAFALANSGQGQGVNQGGFITGGQAGYNRQFGSRFIAGVELDMQGAGIRGRGNSNGFGPVTLNAGYVNNNVIQAGIDWMGTARGRLGYLITPSSLIYATAGLAYGGTYLKTNQTFSVADRLNAYQLGVLSTQSSAEKLLAGWTAGGGAEWMFMRNWSVKAEALYYDLGNQGVTNYQFFGTPQAASTNPVGGSSTRAYYQGVIGRAGINYHFDIAPIPML